MKLLSLLSVIIALLKSLEDVEFILIVRWSLKNNIWGDPIYSYLTVTEPGSLQNITDFWITAMCVIHDINIHGQSSLTMNTESVREHMLLLPMKSTESNENHILGPLELACDWPVNSRASWSSDQLHRNTGYIIIRAFALWMNRQLACCCQFPPAGMTQSLRYSNAWLKLECFCRD